MYKNIYYDRFTKKIHLWTDKGYKVFDNQPYYYKKTNDIDTQYKSIFGDPVEKVYYSNQNDSIKNWKSPSIFESDVMTEVRTLVDLYHEDDSTANNIKIVNLDIEVSKCKKRGYSRPPEVFNFITAITIHDFLEDKKYSLILDPYRKYTGNEDVELFHTEQALLKRFITLWRKLKPDVVTGWNIDFYDMPYLYLRIAQELGLEIANKLSPIDKVYIKEKDPEKGRYDTSISIAGVSQLDYLGLYKNYKYKNQPSYKLDSIAEYELGIKKIEFEGTLHDLWENNINKFVEYNIRDVDIISMLENKLGFIDLHLKMSHISHVPYEFALSSVRLIEGKFLTETKKRNLVCPNIPEKELREISKIIGAFVKQSKKGLFEYLFDLDLTSLYPMIIATLNISPETKVGRIKDYISVWMNKDDNVEYEINAKIFNEHLEIPDYSKEINVQLEYFPEKCVYNFRTVGNLYSFLKEKNCTISCNGIIYSKDKIGEVPKIILELFGIRTEYKQLRIEADKKGDVNASKYNDLMQMAFKIFINSIYGVFCNEYFRFTDRENAQSITLTGQFTNKSAIDSVSKLHKMYLQEIDTSIIKPEHRDLFDDPIITGDTDSIIMSAVPSLYFQYGSDWLNWEEDVVMDKVIEISQIMADLANNRSKDFAFKWLNTDKNYLEFKEEWVARSGFYIGVKKRYANWIRRKEGATVDEVDIKGLDIIRSSFPKHLQDFLKKVLYDILKFVEKDEIFDYIVSVRDDLIENSNSDLEVITFISSANNMQKYSTINGNPKKGTPFHVKGALNFNKFLDVEGLQSEQEKIFEGDKIRVLYLKNNQYGFSEFSYPISGVIPEIEEFISTHLHSKKSIDSLLDNKLEKFYDAMNWNKPNTKYVNIDDLLIST